MYSLTVRRDFVAQHYLIGGDWGPENLPNSHNYILELKLDGEDLNEHGFLVDIVEVQKYLEQVTSYYRDQMLNEKPEFRGLNPSLENFARVLGDSLNRLIHDDNLTGLRVTLWEDPNAAASYHIDRFGAW
jgi:6-pyruvoyltetrahydropterin/6-carboxytetrahydropterin synthase